MTKMGRPPARRGKRRHEGMVWHEPEGVPADTEDTGVTTKEPHGHAALLKLTTQIQWTNSSKNAAMKDNQHNPITNKKIKF